MFDQVHLTSFERLLATSGLSRSFSSVFSGTSRSLRLTYETRSDEDEVIYRLSSGLIAPLSLMFVWWCFETALKNGVKRLYFLSRDGEIFYKTAKVLAKAWSIDIEIRYLYCSRESLLVPSFETAGAFEENWITWAHQGDISLEEVCARINLKVDEVKHLLPQFGLEQYSYEPSKAILPSDRTRLFDLVRCADFSALAKDSVNPIYETTKGYLIQEGMGDGVRFALVDTGWTGSSQYALGSILNKAGIVVPGGIEGYYLGVNSGAYSHVSDLLAGFLFDWRKTRRDIRLYNFICYELLFSGLHGRTTSYRLSSGRYIPVFKGGLEGFSLRASQIHHAVSEEYAQRIAKTLTFDSFVAEDASQLGLDLMMNFICNPSIEISSTYGDWPMAGEIREGDIQSVAPALDFQSFVKCSLGKEKVQGFWPQASLIRGRLKFITKIYNLFIGIGLLDYYRRFILRY